MATQSTLTTTPPHPSSTLVNFSEDADLRLIRLLASTSSDPSKTSEFESACSTCITSGDAAGLIRTVLSQPGAIEGLLKPPSEGGYTIEEAVSAFSLLAALVDRVVTTRGEDSDDGGGKERRELVVALADSIMVDGGNKGSGAEDVALSEKRSAMIAALFNLRSDGVEKTRLLSRIVDLADTSALAPGGPKGVSTLADALDPEAVQASLALWGEVPEVERRELYRAVVRGMDRVLEKLAKDSEKAASAGKGGTAIASAEVEVARKIKAAKERRQMYLLLILETYKDESKLDKEAIAYAQDASLGAIRDPIDLFSSQRRLLYLPAILALQSQPPSTHLPALYDLLKIIQEGKLQDYRDFTAMPDKSTIFSTFHLNEEECMKNMCMLSLVSLAGEHEEIPYTAIASTLDIEEDQVERWVIMGVSSGLMEAKMDQLRKVVLVERCAVRQFGPSEWKALKIRLDKWKGNVRGVLDALKKSGAVTGGLAMNGQ